MDVKKSGSNTLFWSVVSSSPGPIIAGLGLLAGHSSTQIADFVRKSFDLLSMIMSFVIYRITTGYEFCSEEKKEKLERCAKTFVGIMMCAVGLIMIVLDFTADTKDKGKVTAGLILALVGVAINAAFWRKYSKLNKAEPNEILKVQSKLYRAKMLVDGCVSVALLSVAINPATKLSLILDFIGSIVVAVYLIRCGVKIILEIGEKNKKLSH